MLRHVQKASSAEETSDPLKEKDGRPDMFDEAPQVQIVSFLERREGYWTEIEKEYVLSVCPERISAQSEDYRWEASLYREDGVSD